MITPFPNRKWLVIPTTITGSLNFEQIIEQPESYFRISNDGTQTVISYDVTEVTASYTHNIIYGETGETGSYTVETGIYGRPSIYNPDYIEYNHEEILTLLSTDNWVIKRDEII